MTPRRRVALLATIVGALALNSVRSDAHKPITSPYTYNEDIFPILRDRCGRCHVAGGVAPMSLMTHADTVPWGESIRTELLAGQMPPWSVDTAASRYRNVHQLSAREMNLLLTWVTGGTPIGSQDKDPAPMTIDTLWRLGPPDVTLPFPREFTIGGDVREQLAEFIIPTGGSERRWIRAVDLKPGNPAIVRAATIAVRVPASAATSDSLRVERVLGLWLPGDDPVALDEGMAFELPASAELLVRVLYRKTWEYERKELSDRSTVGLYFESGQANAVRSVSLPRSGVALDGRSDRTAFSGTLEQDVRALAIYADVGVANTRVKAIAVRPDGSQSELIAFHPRPDWTRRYWFREPLVLTRGTRLEFAASIDDETPMLPLSVAPTTTSTPDLSLLRLTLNVIPSASAK